MESEYMVTLTISVKVSADSVEEAIANSENRSEWLDWFYLECNGAERIGDWRVTIYYGDGPEDITGPKDYVVRCREIAINNNISVSGISEIS